MKKALFCMIFFILQASDIKENIVKTFKDEDIDVKVVLVEKLNSGLGIAIIEQLNGMQVPVFITNDGHNVMGISEPLILSNQAYQDIIRNIYKKIMEHNKKHTDALIIQKVNADMWITLDGDAKNTSIYLILDANCRYCKQEISKIEEMLKNYKEVKILFCGLLGMDSLQKAAKIYEDIAKLKDQNEKIKFLKSTFDSSFTINKKIDTRVIEDLSKIIMQAGVTGVPYIIISE